MKARIHYILFWGLLFLHPGFTFGSGDRPISRLNCAFQKAQKESFPVIDDFKNENSSFFSDSAVDADADIDLDDDDDGSFSTRRKISFETAASFDVHYYDHHFWDNLYDKYCTPYIYNLPLSHFVSLRVFRL